MGIKIQVLSSQSRMCDLIMHKGNSRLFRFGYELYTDPGNIEEKLNAIESYDNEQ